MLVVGSQALQERGLLPIGRKPMDLDILVTEQEAKAIKSSYTSQGCKIVPSKFGFTVFQGDNIIEVDHSKSTRELLVLEKAVENKHIASLDTLYALKMSHRYLKDSPHFYKTMRDIKYLRGLGATLPSHLEDWFKLREEETYTYAHPKLNVDKDSFFDETEDFYIKDHDSLHDAVVQGTRPAYLEFKPEQEDVLCSKEMFDACSYHTKLTAVVEEAMVLSLERSLIPNNFNTDQKRVFKYALMKISSSITSGWFREFCWENFEEAMNYFHTLPDNYLKDTYALGLKNNIIKPFKKEK